VEDEVAHVERQRDRARVVLLRERAGRAGGLKVAVVADGITLFLTNSGTSMSTKVMTSSNTIPASGASKIAPITVAILPPISLTCFMVSWASCTSLPVEPASNA